MQNGLLIKLAASSMVVAGLTVAQNAYADAVPRTEIAASRAADRVATRAERALAKDPARAVADAEQAVALAPASIDHRVLLGRTYLANGRFRAAAAAFEDALTLAPARSDVALSLALARIALGEAEAARALVETHGAALAAGDRGLALTLAGDPAAGIAVLEGSVRAGGADAKTRQNLAFSYALAGRWIEAKLMASYDLPANLVAQRIMDWSRIAREGAAANQVAFLLNVQPAEDAGMPTRLALAPSAPAPIVSAPVLLARVAPPPPARVVDTAAFDAVAGGAVAAPEALAQAGVIFAAPREVVQPIARSAVRTAAAPMPAPVARFRPAAFTPTGHGGTGRYVVQLGAYSSADRVAAGWSRAVAALGALESFTPARAAFRNGQATFYRLSVGGFDTRGEAVLLCTRLKAAGRSCFVRETAGDRPLQWAAARRDVRIAAR
jgi:hypothetical protein